MPQQSYDLNDTARLSVNFKVNGVLTNPTAITATVRKPSGTTTVYTTATSPAIVNDGTGLYHLDITADQARQWAYKFVGTGTAADTGPGVFYTRPDPTNTPEMYVPLDALKATLKVVGTDSDPDMCEAILSACRAIDNACGRRFYPDTVDRYFTADYFDTRVSLDDVRTITAVTVDDAGAGTYPTTWVEGTDFYLSPVGAATVDGEPFTEMILMRQAARRFPPYANNIKVTGTFGWATPPPGVRQYAEILSAKLLRRTTDAPFGFVLSGNDLGSITRLARTDPDAEILIGPYRRTRLLV
jgi:hypothetical protein